MAPRVEFPHAKKAREKRDGALSPNLELHASAGWSDEELMAAVEAAKRVLKPVRRLTGKGRRG